VAVADLNGDGNADIIVVTRGRTTSSFTLGWVGIASKPTHLLHRDRSRGAHRRRPHRHWSARPHRGQRRVERPEHLYRGGAGSELEAGAGPRLPVGDQPVSTTVADLNSDGIPDIICVDRGAIMWSCFRGRRGFFDDSDPLTLPTARVRSRVRRQVRRRPGLDLAVLDSGSSD